MNLFEGAIANSAVATQIANAFVTAATQCGVASDPVSIVQAALTNTAFGTALQSALATVAANNQLTFNPPQQSQLPVPSAILFVAGALIFTPSVFKSVGGTVYGDGGGTVAPVDGISSFG